MSALMNALHRRLRERRRTAEHGFSMTEMVVAMVIMSICGAIFTLAVVSLNRSSAKAQAVTQTTTQTNQAYLVLDKLVRYAAVVTTPARSTGTGATGDWYVELRDTTSGTEVCHQLRVDIATQQLQRRSWTVSNMAGTLTNFRQIAPGITNGAEPITSTDRPFILVPPGSTAIHQKLTITLIARSGLSTADTTTRSSFTLSALNSDVPPPTGTLCQQAGRP